MIVRSLELASASSFVMSMWSCQWVMILAVSFPIPDTRVRVFMGALRMASGESSNLSSLRTLTGPIFGSILSAIVASRFVMFASIDGYENSASFP